MTLDQIAQIQFAVDTAMAMLIWLVQLVIYPVFRDVAPEMFHAWHLNYMKTISRIVIPLMLIQLLCHGYLSLFQSSILQWAAVLSIIMAWVVTFTLSVPCHQALQKSGYQTATINRLIRTNWLRTVCWSLPAVLQFV